MVKAIVNGIAVDIKEGATILEASRKAGVTIPTLCHHDEFNHAGCCRICAVEVEGEEDLATACDTVVWEGMRVNTTSERVMGARKRRIERLMANHDLRCAECDRDGTCVLQRIYLEYALSADETFRPEPCLEDAKSRNQATLKHDGVISHNESRCVKCGRCVTVCRDMQGIGVWKLTGSGDHARLQLSRGASSMQEAGCVACGQCVVNCPTGAMTSIDETDKLLAALDDANVTTVAQVAPAARALWASSYDEKGIGFERVVSGLKAMGVDYVYDTSFGADLTVVEEAEELLSRLDSEQDWPLFTSCCPAWVSYTKGTHPELMPHLSSCKSPMLMLGSLLKSEHAKDAIPSSSPMFSTAIMPCTAKKVEAAEADVDLALTVRELGSLLCNEGVDILGLSDTPADCPFGEASGAGVIFGSAGGVMTAALRTAYRIATGCETDPDGFTFNATEDRQWKEASFRIGEKDIRCATVSTLANAESLIRAIARGEVAYDFVEVMACPGGCAGGGGQPIDALGRNLESARGEILRDLDKKGASMRRSHENASLNKLYESGLKESSHSLLHTEH